MSDDLDIPNPFEKRVDEVTGEVIEVIPSTTTTKTMVQTKTAISKEVKTTLPALSKDDDYQKLKAEVSLAQQGGFLPPRINFSAAVLIVQTGKTLGMTPIEALQCLHCVEGRVSMSAKAMLARVYKFFPEAVVRIMKSDDTECLIEAARKPGDPLIQFPFTLEQAKKIGMYPKKDNWRNYPANMLRARCISAAVNALWPEVTHGAMHTPDELGADTDSDGNYVPRAQKPRADLKSFNEKYANKAKEFVAEHEGEE